jgi:serine/threonine protein kinase
LQHERFAGQDWAKIRLIAAHLVEALSTMHIAGLLHGDVKPLNVVRHEGRWRLIDLDCACELGEPFGTKQPSTGYCPPEMARVIRDAKLAGATPGSAAMEVALAKYTADAAYDMWSLGAVLYQLFTGVTLFQCDLDDDAVNLNLVCKWNASTRTQKLGVKELRPPPTGKADAAVSDLLFKLLEPDPTMRAAHFLGAFYKVSEHPFFSIGTNLEAMV